MTAYAGPDGRVDRSCQLSFRIHVPAGYSVALLSAHNVGAQQLAAGVRGIQTSEYALSGQPATRRIGTVSGSDSFWGRDDAQPTLWSACGVDTAATIKSTLSVNNAGAWESPGVPASGWFGTYSITTVVAWKRC
jgi:hypothetical protein